MFEINEGEHHDHLICLQCGQVDEFRNEAIEALQRKVASTRGYQLADHRLALYGYCSSCVGAHKNAAAPASRSPATHTEE